VPLDYQVDAQPLVLANVQVAGVAHTVVYVATENDTVYAVDTATGTILLSQSLGTPVPRSALPGACANNGPAIGINSTPVIDPATGTLYVIADTYANGTATFYLHALDTGSLADKVPPVAVTGTHLLSDGTIAAFNANVQRQRPALLEAGGIIYAGFGSYCDQAANTSRGWILGWSAATLAPLAANDVTDTLATSPLSRFLSAIWMSGAGIAADATGSIYFVTGNSDPASYDGTSDIQESVVREAGNLSKMETLFTPSNEAVLDKGDKEIGSGGVLLVPSQAGVPSAQHLAVAAGKDGRLFVLNAYAMGRFHPKYNNVLGIYPIGGCWCGESYFVGSDGVPRIVTSGGSQVGIWELTTTPKVTLTLQSQSAALQTGQDPGFFTTVSSNGEVPGSAVIWAVSRPLSKTNLAIGLYAFDAVAGATLFTAPAGFWGGIGGNANLVPVVANGEVFVASDAQLAIFGLLPPAAARPHLRNVATSPVMALATGGHEFFGTIVALHGETLSVRLRSGRFVTLDATAATRASRTTTLYLGEAVLVEARDAGRGSLVTESIQRAKDSPALWWSDR
jgi:outer membrane protein assembly factor BamB